MKKVTLVLLTLLTVPSTELFGQQKISVKLTNEQMQRVNVLRNETVVEVTFGGLIDNVLKKYKFKDFQPTYPLAKFFNHPASERVSQYYTFVIDSTDSADQRFLAELQHLRLFETVEPINDPIPTYTPNDFALVDPPVFSPNQGSQWYLTLIKAQEAWEITKGSATVKIAIIDNGFFVYHEDLINQISYTHGDVAGALDHGSMVSGLAAAETDNSKGLSSIGFNSKLMLYLFNDVYNNMMDASLNGAKVINCSFIHSGCNYSQAQQDIINMVTSNGTTIVAAAGNGTASPNCGDPDQLAYPASYDNVISVSGTWYDSYISNSSTRFTFNNKVDLTAPGWELTTTGGSNPTFYTNQSGTSLAAPIVTGTVALMNALKNCLKPSEVEYILKKTADQGVFNTQVHPENAPYVNTSGAGRLDANAALQFTQNWPQSLTNYVYMSGPQIICTSGTFALNDIPPSANVSWSTNYPHALSITSSGFATRQGTYSGQVTVTAK